MRLTVAAMVEKAHAADAAGFVGMAGLDHTGPAVAHRPHMSQTPPHPASLRAPPEPQSPGPAATGAD